MLHTMIQLYKIYMRALLDKNVIKDDYLNDIATVNGKMFAITLCCYHHNHAKSFLLNSSETLKIFFKILNDVIAINKNGNLD